MNRRLFLRILAISGCACASWAAVGRTATAQDSGDTPALKDVLESGLKARLPFEFAFIHKVVAKVDANTLPRDMVMSTFLWARRYPRPFPYFVRALKLRAQDAGINL